MPANVPTGEDGGGGGAPPGGPGPYRPAAPPTADRIVWPGSFGLRFTLLVDTEEEFDWERPLARANRGTAAMRALPAGHTVFAEVGLRPAYMIDHPIATDPWSVDVLRRLVEDGTALIGTQLHPWVNPPFEEEVCGHNSFLGNLPADLQARKLDTLTDAIADAFGRRPTAFRCGRYGLGLATLALLEARGYTLDSSMRGRYDYSREGGPDYSRIGGTPFWCGPNRSLIEMPLSNAFTGLLRAGGAGLWNGRMRQPLTRAHLLGLVALTPEDMPLASALEAIRVLVGEGERLLRFSYHSPSLAPGYTPYVKDAAGLAEFYRWWDGVFRLLARLGATPVDLDEIVETAHAARR